MGESDVVYFIMWSAITAIIMGITGFSYRSFIRRRKNENTPS